MTVKLDTGQAKRCRLIAEVAGPPDADYKYCVYKCQDWLAAPIARAIKKDYNCPTAIDWWDKSEIPGAL